MKKVAIVMLFGFGVGVMDASAISFQDLLKQQLNLAKEAAASIYEKIGVEHDGSKVCSFAKLNTLSPHEVRVVLDSLGLPLCEFDDLQALEEMIRSRGAVNLLDVPDRLVELDVALSLSMEDAKVIPIATEAQYAEKLTQLKNLVKKETLTLADAKYALDALHARYDSSVRVKPVGMTAHAVMMSGSQEEYNKVIIYFNIAIACFNNGISSGANKSSLQELVHVLFKAVIAFFEVHIESKKNLASIQISDGDVKDAINKVLHNTGRSRTAQALAISLNVILPEANQIKGL